MIEHPKTDMEVYSVEWKKMYPDITELANLRWKENWFSLGSSICTCATNFSFIILHSET